MRIQTAPLIVHVRFKITAIQYRNPERNSNKQRERIAHNVKK